MDTHELRLAFTASQPAASRALREMHRTAIAGAQGEAMPFQVNEEPYAVISVIPLGFFREGRDLPITPGSALAPVKPAGPISWRRSRAC